MTQQTPTKRVLFVRSLLVAVFVLVGVFAILLSSLRAPERAYATTSNTLNFQARLESASGAVAADGNYNVEFNIYRDNTPALTCTPSTGTNCTSVWTEDWLNSAGQGIHISNGYLTASLGSITAFSSSINWDQQLYVSMTVRGTASCTFGTCSPTDAAMLPYLKLTAVPYAFSAGQLQTTTPSGPFTSKLTLLAPTVGNQNFQIQDQGAAGTYNVLTALSGTDGYVKLQGSTPGTQQTGNLNISGAGIFGGAASSVGFTTTAGLTGSGGAISLTGSAASGLSTTSGLLTLQGAGGVTLNSTNTTVSGGITIQSGNSSAGTAGTIAIDTGTSSSGTSVISLGTANASAINIGNTTAATAVNIVAGNTGAVNLGSVGTSTLSSTVNIGTTTNATGTQTVNIGSINNVNNAVKIESGITGAINIGAANSAHTINIGTGNTTDTVNVGNTNSASALNLGAGTGGFTLAAVGAGGTGSITANGGGITITAAGASTWSTSAGALAVQAAGALNLNTSSGTTSNSINIQSGNASTGTAGTISIDNGTSSVGTGTINIGIANSRAIVIGTASTTTTLNAAAAGTLNVGSGVTSGTTNLGTGITSGIINLGVNASSGAGTLNIANAATQTTAVQVGTGSGAQTLNFGTGAAVKTVGVGSSTSGSATTLQGGATVETLNNAGANIQTTTNTTTAFQVQNASGTPIFLVDTATTLNLVTNPGFEVNVTTGWTGVTATLTKNTTKGQYYHGQASMTVAVTTNGGGAQATGFTSAITPAAYNFSFYAMNLNAGALGVTVVGGSAPACTLNSTSMVTTGFQRYYCSFTSTTTNVTAITITSTTTGTFYIDGVQLTSGATVQPYGAQGAIQLRGIINSPATFQSTSNSTTAFQIQNSAGTSNLFIADTINNRIGINNAAPAYSLDVTGDINSSTAIRVGGTTVCTSSGCTASGAANQTLSNLTGPTAINTDLTFANGANRALTVAAAAAGAGNNLTVSAGTSGTGAVNGGNLTLQAGATGGTGTSGSVIVKSNGTNSTTAFQIQNAAGTASIFTADTVNSVVKVQSTNNSSVLGAEMMTAGESFPATGGWTAISGTGTSVTATHTNGGGTTAISPTPALTVVAGQTYQITYSATAATNATGYVYASIGGVNGSFITRSPYGSVVEVLKATSTANLSFVPTNDWPGTVSAVSVKPITATNVAIQLNDSTGADAGEIRTGAATLQNVYMGLGAGAFNDNGSGNANQNTGLGANALGNNLNGSSNVAVGASALLFNTSGLQNVAVGVAALSSNKNGDYNTASGYQALTSNSTGNYNSAYGYQTLQGNINGEDNSGFGNGALGANTSGFYNTGIGDLSLAFNTTGSNNTGLGYQSLYANGTGSNNSAVGYYAGYHDLNNKFSTSAALQNATALGAYAQVQANNTIVLGSVDNPSQVVVGATVPVSTNSFGVSPVDLNSTTITATQTSGSGTITASGAIFSAANVGEELVWADGTSETITAFTSTTVVTGSSTTITESAKYFRTHHIGFQVTNTGDAYVRSSSATAFQIQTASGTPFVTANNSTAGAPTLAIVSSGSAATALSLQNASNQQIFGFNNGTRNFSIGGSAAGSGQIVFTNTGASFTTTISATTATAARTITIPDASGALCLDSGNCSTAGSGYILNQSSSPGATQTGNFNISGTGFANILQGSTHVYTVDLDTSVTGTLSIGSTFTNNIVVGNTANNSAISLNSGTGTIAIGTADQARTINIGTGGSTTAQTVAIGSTNSGSTTTIKGGTGGGVAVQSSSTTAFRIQNSGATATVLTADTTNSKITLQAGGTDATLAAAAIDTAAGTPVAPFTTGWTTTGWTVTANSATHTTGNTSALTSTFTPTIGTSYQVSYNYTLCTAANTLSATMGGVQLESSTSCTGSNTVIITATSTSPLVFTPNSTYNGVVSNVKVQAITQVGSVLTVNNSSSVATIEVRSSGTNNNTFIGLNSGRNNTSSGIYNTALGTSTLQSNTTGYGNTAVGFQSLQNTSSGFENVGVGVQALSANTSGDGNNAIGARALLLNSVGSSNNAFGADAQHFTTTGSNNAAFGDTSLYNNTTGTSNSALGTTSGFSNTTGSYNTYIGYSAGYQDSDGFATLGNNNFSSALGIKAQVQASNAIVIGGTGSDAVNVGIGTTIPRNAFSVSPVDTQAGTAGTGGASANTVTGVSTAFTASMVGEQIIWADGQNSTVASVTSATSLTLTTLVTEANTATYRIHRIGFQVTNGGNAYLQNTSTTAFQVLNNSTTSGTSVLTVDTTNKRVNIGVGSTGETSPSILVLDNQTGSSSDPTGVNGAMYYNATTNTFRCYQNGAWGNCIGMSSDVQRQFPFYSTDFLSGIQAGNTSTFSEWEAHQLGTGIIQTANANEVTPSHPGVVKIGSNATTANSGYSWTTDPTALSLGGGETFEAVWSPTILANSQIQLGFTNTNTAEPTNGAYMWIINGVVTGKTATGSVRTSTGSTYTTTTVVWYRSKIVVNPTATQVDFYLYNDAGTQLWHDSITTNIPTGTNTTGTGFAAINTTAQLTTVAHLDYMAQWNTKQQTR